MYVYFKWVWVLKPNEKKKKRECNCKIYVITSERASYKEEVHS